MTSSKIKPTKIYMSYDYHENKKAQKISATLVKSGYAITSAQQLIKIGSFSSNIAKAINNSEVLIALLTPHAVREDAPILDEISYAKKLGKTIIPINGD